MKTFLNAFLTKHGYNPQDWLSTSDFVQIVKNVCKPDREIALKMVFEAFSDANSKFYLRGLGTHTTWLISKLHSNGLFDRILGIVDKATAAPFLHPSLNLNVFPLQAITLMPGQKILIAHEQWENEMVRELSQFNLSKTELLTIYTSEAYTERLVEKILAFDDRQCEIPVALRQKIANRRVLVVNGYTCEILISYKCQEILETIYGWQIIRINVYELNDAPNRDNDAILQCNGRYDKLLSYVALLKPDVIIAEDHFNNCQLAVILLTLFFPKTPIISTYYDLIHIHIENDAKRRLQYISEKLAIESSNGIIHRTFPTAIEYLHNKYHINCKRAIDFQPYASKTLFPEIVIKHKHRQFNLVSAHSIVPTAGANSVGTLESDVIGLYEIVLSQGINVDIFFKGADAKMMNRDYNDYIALQERYHNLKIHQGVSQQELSIILRRYDFALILHTDDELPHVRRISASKFETSGRYYFYLAMGLPIITTGFVVNNAALVKDNGVGIVICSNALGNLKNDLKSVNYRLLQQNVIQFREKLALENQVNRLGRFINGIME